MSCAARALALAACICWCLAAAAWADQAPTSPDPEQPRTVVILESAPVLSGGGEALGRAKAFTAWPLAGQRPGAVAVPWPHGRQGVEDGWLPAQAVAVLPGDTGFHAGRLERIQKATLTPAKARRLAAGRAAQGDAMHEVEMAWGPPQRFFMVNHISDEQHFVYLTPGGRPVLMRFVAGRLDRDPPAPTLADASQVEAPARPR